MSCSRLDFRNIEEELLNWPCILAKSLPQLKYVKCLFKWNFFGFRTTFHLNATRNDIKFYLPAKIH